MLELRVSTRSKAVLAVIGVAVPSGGLIAPVGMGTADFTVTTQDVAPLAFVPKRVIAQLGSPASLDGQSSTDPNGLALEYCCVVRDFTQDDATMQGCFTVRRAALDLDNAVGAKVFEAQSRNGE